MATVHSLPAFGNNATTTTASYHCPCCTNTTTTTTGTTMATTNGTNSAPSCSPSVPSPTLSPPTLPFGQCQENLPFYCPLKLHYYNKQIHGHGGAWGPPSCSLSCVLICNSGLNKTSLYCTKTGVVLYCLVLCNNSQVLSCGTTAKSSCPIAFTLQMKCYQILPPFGNLRHFSQ
jgi:hypothetical protein